jgi:DNA polymerase III delta prime subunit
MEEYSKNCGFILTANYKNRIIEPLHSRCSVIEFIIHKENKPVLANKFLKRVQDILKEENVEYDKKAVVELIIKHFPDWRRIINELQRYSTSGKIDAGILTQMSDGSFNTLIQALNMKETSIPILVTTIADYQYKSAFVADQEINLVACLTALMIECEFK